MLTRFFSPQVRRCLLIEQNPHQILVIGLMRPRRGPAVVETVAEFPAGSLAAVRRWLDEQPEYRRNWLMVVCGFVPRQALLQRESLRGDDLVHPTRLGNFLRDQQARRVGSSAPFREATAEEWVFRAVRADDGHTLPARPEPQPALVFGTARQEVREAEQRLLDHRLMPARMEAALLPLFGSIYGLMARRHQAQATVVFVIREDLTLVYILGKEGVHTPPPGAEGLDSLVEQVRRETGLDDVVAARRRLFEAGDDLRARAARLVRPLAGSVRPAIDSYEMTTGQPVGQIYCAYLPPALGWLMEPLARAVGHELLAVDCADWLRTVGLQAAPDLPPLGPHWLGAISLASHLPENPTLDLERSLRAGGSFQRPWHVDVRQSLDLPDPGVVRRRFLVGAVAAALALAALTIAAWQVVVTQDLRADMTYWRDEMAANRQLANELTAAVTLLETRRSRLEAAHALMAAPFQPSEFLMSLGRSLPPRMRLDRVEANPERIILAGSLLEPAEEASRSLGAYLEGLRRAPEFRGRFAGISATSLQRESGDDSLAFEITMRFAAPSP